VVSIVSNIFVDEIVVVIDVVNVTIVQTIVVVGNGEPSLLVHCLY